MRVFWRLHKCSRRSGGKSSVKVRCLAVDQELTESAPWCRGPGMETHTHGFSGRVCESRNRGDLAFGREYSSGPLIGP